MLSMIMETGQALYVLAGIAGLGIFTRLLTRNLYKRLMKESTNLAAAKNRGLKELRQRAENAYYVNQGMRDTGSWVEHQLSELHFRGMTLAGWNNLSVQLSWLCLLAGGAGAFYAYWTRMDTSYIVLYGCGAILMTMTAMLFDGSIAAARKEQLIAALQDYLENTMFPRLGRIAERGNASVRGAAADRRTAADRGGRSDRGVLFRSGTRAERENASESEAVSERNGTSDHGIGSGPEAEFTQPVGTEYEEASIREDGYRKRSRYNSSHPSVKRAAFRKKSRSYEKTEDRSLTGKEGGMSANAAAQAGSLGEPMPLGTDDLKRGLEQIAASRERSRQHPGMQTVPRQSGNGNSSRTLSAVPTAASLLKELSPDELQVISDILKQYLN